MGEIHKLNAAVQERNKRITDLEERINRAYSERNFTAVLATALAVQLGLPAGRGVDDNEEWDIDWRHVVYIDLPNGTQMSWHIAPQDLSLLDPIPEYEGKWDGTFCSRDVRGGVAVIEALLQKEASKGDK